MKAKQFVIVSYDIADEERLRKIAKIMEDYGFRVLYSVFECYINRSLFEEMKTKVEKLIDHPKAIIFHDFCYFS